MVSSIASFLILLDPRCLALVLGLLGAAVDMVVEMLSVLAMLSLDGLGASFSPRD